MKSSNVLKSLVLAALLPASVAAATDLPPLADNERVSREFLAVAVGDEIRQECPSISARLIYVLRKANDLENYAISLGYTKDDIREMRKNSENKAALRARRDAYLTENGVVVGDADSYCRLGRKEIAEESLIGSLIWAR